MNHKIAVIGLGYVGLPLVCAFSKKFQTIGFDINPKRIAELSEGIDTTLEVEEAELRQCMENGLFFTDKIEDIASYNTYIITVPTPIDASNHPDLTPLIKASESIGKVLKIGDVVIYESTVYPGVTEEVCVPILEKYSRLRYNEDFFCGYSPERINPGDKKHTLTNILKITSGSTPEIAQTIDRMYASIIEAGTYLVSSIKVAEAAKVIENTQRDVNIALINELAHIFHTMNIDTNEVLDAAATKWNFINLRPGLVGGHCIGIDPYYLTYKSQELGYKPNLILGARQINDGMSRYIMENTIKLMIKHDKHIKNAPVLIMGLTFKENCPDTRNSKVFDLIEELNEYECEIDVFDPWVDHNKIREIGFRFIDDPLQSDKKYDAVIVAVAHNQFKDYTHKDYLSITTKDPVIIDIKNIVENPTWRL